MVLTLTLDNSYSKIEGLSITEFNALRKILSYCKFNFTSPLQHRTYLIDKKGNFPSGVLYLVERFLKGLNRKDIEIKDLRVIPVSKTSSIRHFKLDFVLYSEQSAIGNIWFNHHRGIISACTGFGKSVAMAALIHRLGLKTLVVVPNLTLKQQLTETFTSIFGDLTGIVIENIDSAALNKLDNFDVLIVDEAHHAAAKTYRMLNKKVWNKIFFRYFFTATPYRSRDEEQILFESICGEVIYTVSYQHAAAKGYICPVEAYYCEIPKTPVKADRWAGVYNELVVNNNERNNILFKLLISLSNQKQSTLLLVKEIAHGEYLSKVTGIPFVNGKAGNQDLIADFNSKAFPCLIGTVGVLGEGVDTKAAEFVIVAGLGRSRNQFLQMVGRGVRVYHGKPSCKVIIFEDKSHKWTKSHFKEQCKFLKEEYGVVPGLLQVP
jgi:superfamily II DNA or RNA helicase